MLALTIAATVVMATAPASASAPLAVTLEEALERGLKHAPQVVRAQAEKRNARAAERTALGAWLPSASLGSGSTVSSSSRFISGTDVPLTGSNTSLNAGVSVAWDVFTGGRRGADQRRAAAQSGAADAQLDHQRTEIALLVERAFYDEQRAEELEAVAVARVERARQGLDAAERRAKAGAATRSDVLRAKLELNTAQEGLRQAETQRWGAAHALGRFIGHDGPADARLTSPMEPTPLATAETEIVGILVATAPAVQSAEASLQAARAGIGAARAQYYPSLRLSAGQDWFSQQLEWQRPQTAWSVRLGLNWPIFDNFRRNEMMVRAETQEIVTRAQLEDARRAVRADAERALAELRLQADRVGFAKQAVEVAEEDYRVQRERYSLGLSTMLDLLTSQSSLVQAESGRITALFDYQITRAALEALAGRRL